MNSRQLIGAAAMALLLAPAAFAGTAAKPSPASCKALEQQFDKAADSSHAANLNQAKLLRTEGAELCTQKKASEGKKKLEEAIKMLGPTPTSN